MAVKVQSLNRLAAEKSPYLLQHIHDPVAWQAWGEGAFDEAVRLDRPVFLSIGYSACHWCHVMAQESFSDEIIAEKINGNFIPVKVDREEYPDLDNYFIKAVTAITGSAGWPLTVFLTPGKLPFFGGSYFPPQDADGRPGLLTVLDSVAAAWKDNREEVLAGAEKISVLVTLNAHSAPEPGEVDSTVMRRGYDFLRNNFDPVNGGFGTQPKFPIAFYIIFLLRYDTCFREPRSREMALATLRGMSRGGIHDQLAGGFPRYSTDERWFLPHFEKMLYDQALISLAYLEAFSSTGDMRLAHIGRDTIDFVLSRMTGPEGAFFASFDADSFPSHTSTRGEEGAFYLWTKAEVDDLLGGSAPVFCFHFGIMPGGNIPRAPSGDFRGKNVLFEAHTVRETAAAFKLSEREILRILVRACEHLREARDKRPWPRVDDQILCDWNSLMISSLCIAHTIFPLAGYSRAAERAAEFILGRMRDGGGALLHRFRDGEGKIPGLLDDYAFFTAALLDLNETTESARYLREALRVAELMIEMFRDSAHKGFFISSTASTDKRFAQKELFDGAIPSGSAVALSDMVRLYALTGNRRWKELAAELVGFSAGDLARAPYSHINFLSEMFSFVGREECGCERP